MEDRTLAQAVLDGVRNNTGELKENGVSLDGRFVRDLSQALHQAATKLGLDKDLARTLRQTALGPVAKELGL